MGKASLGAFASLDMEVSQSGHKSPGNQDSLVLVLKNYLCKFCRLLERLLCVASLKNPSPQP